ncbi:MAG: response regulator [Vicinamibacteria bacterium]
MSAARILLVDDHALVRAGFRSLLESVEGVQVLGEAGDGHEALRLIAELQPDVVFLDIALPGLNGLDVAARAAKEHAAVRVVILSMHANEEYVLRALQAGAAGYMLKDASVPELALALRAVLRGEIYLSPAISKRVVEDYVKRTGAEPAAAPSASALTPRQREVLQLVAEGSSTKEIAHRLNVSVKTVETHRAQLMDRLDIHDVAGLVRYAIRVGLVNSDR